MLPSFDNAESKWDLWGCWFFYSGKGSSVVRRVCCGSRVDTHCCHGKQLIYKPVVGESRQLYFLSYRRTRFICNINLWERENVQTEWLSGISTAMFSCWRSSPVTFQLHALRGRPTPCWYYLVFQQWRGGTGPGGAGGWCCPHPDCWSPQKSSYKPPQISIF